MNNGCKESLINYLSDIPSSKDEIEKLVFDRVISNEEAAILNMRIAAQKLDQKVNSLVEKAEELVSDAGIQPCATP